MKIKKISFIAVLLAATMCVPCTVNAGHKIRIGLTTGYDLVNGLSGGQYLSEEAKIAAAFPVSDNTHPVNTEISIDGSYGTNFAGTKLSSVAFGFGIRVFLNTLENIRPYFTHEIMTRVLYLSSFRGAAKTFSVLLGLGVDIPLQADRDGSSIYFDVSYLFYDSGYFGVTGDKVKTPGITAGYSWGF